MPKSGNCPQFTQSIATPGLSLVKRIPAGMRSDNPRSRLQFARQFLTHPLFLMTHLARAAFRAEETLMERGVGPWWQLKLRKKRVTVRYLACSPEYNLGESELRRLDRDLAQRFFPLRNPHVGGRRPPHRHRRDENRAIRPVPTIRRNGRLRLLHGMPAG